MCGIIGYAGRNQGLPKIIEGLRRLEYRGYDSAGVALITSAGISTIKRAGKLAALEGALDKVDLPPSVTGIGHTRWATHGAPNDRNAHPHLNPAQELAIIHNGIIENYVSLRRELESEGNDFLSETDSEVVAHLLGQAYEKCGGDLAEAMRQTCLRLEGAFSLVAIHAKSPDQVVGARRNSPLVVGVGKNERFLASDVAAFIEHTSDAIELGQDQVVLITPDAVSITDFFGKKVNGKEFKVTWDAAAAQKDGHPHFMAKEIMEQPKAVADTLLGRLDEKGKLILNEIRIAEEDLRDVEKIIIIGCGSAFHAGMIAKYAIEHWTRIPVEVELASEFRYRDPIIDRGTLVIAISQSGETMDTLMALRHA
jgi:glucosamine--fructose-6-phosphate aminotransferase (isomerizing)